MHKAMVPALQLLVLMLAMPVPFAAQPLPSNCTDEVQRDALLELYAATGGAQWFSSANWGSQSTTGGCKIAEVGKNTSSVTVPDHCCWEGVFCCSGEPCPALYQDAAECNCQKGRVTRLLQRFNNLQGEFPIASLRKLNCAQDFRRLEVQNNDLHGET